MDFIRTNFGLITALLASILWGLNYTLFEKISHKTNIFSLIFFEYLICTIITFLLAIVFGNIKTDVKDLYEIKSLFFTNIIVYLSASLLIMMSIKYSNAVTAGLIEISYPLFIFIFSYFILKDVQIDLKTIIAAILIFIGVGLLIIK